MANQPKGINLSRFAWKNRFPEPRGTHDSFGVSDYVSYVSSTVYDRVYVVNDGQMALQTDLVLHGFRLINDGQGGFSFDSGGVISMHGDMNTNGYSLIGKNGVGSKLTMMDG